MPKTAALNVLNNMLRGEFPDADYSTIYGLATGDTDN
jgi:hypothetical protein